MAEFSERRSSFAGYTECSFALGYIKACLNQFCVMRIDYGIDPRTISCGMLYGVYCGSWFL